MIWRNSWNITTQSAFLVCYRFGGPTVDEIASLSQAVDTTVGGLMYGQHNAHVTVSDYQLTRGHELLMPGRMEPGEIDRAADVLNRLSEAVALAVKQKPEGEHFIDFGYGDDNGVFTNGETVTMAGTPSIELDKLSHLVVLRAAELGIELRLPWGYHVTVSRFTENRRRSEIDTLLELLRTAPRLGRRYPVAVEVGLFNTDPRIGFDYRVASRHEL